ncbi:zinc finger protein Elbow [Bradysia coprophila]|uniref:zinc finger protein Elbow n=1 Tax=Bradysia coprophila TaxID=38358 RepID=UPI00187DA901|nr:zinc finger protein Elbow [Bradysia coprophila]
MLTSSNQYIRPDYLAPMPNALDAKNSPLALLAQTCSAIGSDAPNAKLISNMEKSSKSHKTDNRDKSSPGSQHSSLSNSSSEIQQKSSFKPYESSFREQRTVTTPEDRSTSVHRIKTPKTSSTPMQSTTNGRCESNQSASSQRASPATNSRKTPSNSEHNASPHRASSKESSSIPISMSQGSPLYSSSKLSDSTRESSVSYPKTSSAIPVTSSSAFFSGYTSPGLPYPMDLMAASALMSPHHAMFKAASMNPYLNYARMKVPGATDSMMPVCRDPYCTGCALSPHMMGKSPGTPCPAGCTQCDHSSASKSYASQLSAAHGQVAAAYAHAQLAALAAASQLPYICNWIAGDAAYCGKRFGTSDELLSHLRSHTSSIPEAMLTQAAATGLPPNHPLFQRNYPTPPLSPARYQPYHLSKPSLMPPSLAPPPSLAGLPMPHPSLAQYFSPYSLYGPRIGQSHP